MRRGPPMGFVQGVDCDAFQERIAVHGRWCRRRRRRCRRWIRGGFLRRSLGGMNEWMGFVGVFAERKQFNHTHKEIDLPERCYTRLCLRKEER